MKCVRLHPKQGRLILSLLYTQLTSPLCPCWTPTNPPKKRPAGRWGVFGAAKAPPKQRGCPPVDARAFVFFPVTPFFLCGSYPRPFASLRMPSPRGCAHGARQARGISKVAESCLLLLLLHCRLQTRKRSLFSQPIIDPTPNPNPQCPQHKTQAPSHKPWAGAAIPRPTPSPTTRHQG